MVVNFPPASNTALMPITDLQAGVALANTTIFSKTYKVAITRTSNNAGNTFTITGTDVNGAVISETLTGAAANVHAISTKQYATVTSIISKTGGVAAAVTNLKAGVEDLIAQSQSTAGATALILNVGDNSAFTFVPSPATAFLVAFTSTADESGVNFTIVGTDNAGAPQTKVVVGPNANTVFSADTFNSIISITPDGAVTNISVGTEVYLAALQNTPANGVFVLGETTFPNQEWLLALSSPNNLSASTFHITGTNLAGASSEFKAGPNANSVNSANNYSTVTSIQVNTAAAAITLSVPDYISANQTVAGAANAILQQNVITFPTGTAYHVTLTSAADNSASTFTITGTNIAGGAIIENTLVGPNNATVVSLNAFHTISSITQDNGQTALSAGAYGLIAATQNVVAAATGSLPLTLPYPVILPNLQRKLNFSSVQNNAGITITINGLDLYGNAFTETLTGPNGGTVTSVYQYHIINNITTSGDFFAMSVGWDSTCILQWLFLNTFATFPNTTIEAIKTGVINYSVNQTMDTVGYYKPAGPSYQFESPKAVFLADNPLVTVNGSPLVTVTVPSTASLHTGDMVTIQGAAATNNISAANLNINAQITVIDATHFSYAAGGNANDVPPGGGANVYYYFPALPISFPIVAGLTNATTSQLYTLTTPASGIQAIVNSSSAGGALILNVTQQGIT